MKRKLPILVFGLVAILIGIGGIVWWKDKRHYETTDNAYIQADTVTVTPQIEGYVAEVLVGDNERVETGQVLVRLDATDPQARLAQASAQLAGQQAAVTGVDRRASVEEAMIAERRAAVEKAEADAAVSRRNLELNESLAKEGYVTRQRVEDLRAQASAAAAQVAQAKAALEAETRTASSLGVSRQEFTAQAGAADAALSKARADLDRVTVRAPASGVIGARSVRAGQYVRPGASLMAIVPLGRTYVLANFKETQVARLRIGQPVEIHADAFGKQTIKGRVESFSPATGSEFALIPVENAVGNFTKITQRLPVKIAVETDQPLSGALRPGLSVKVKVDVTVRSGASFVDSGVGAPLAAAPVAGR